MNKSTRYSPEVRERAVRLLFEQRGEYGSEWAALVSIASKIGCTAETLRKWVRRTETDQGMRAGIIFYNKYLCQEIAVAGDYNSRAQFEKETVSELKKKGAVANDKIVWSMNHSSHY